MNKLYPLFIRISGKACLIAGGGAVAQRKAEGMLECGAGVCIVSPALTEGLEKRAHEKSIQWKRRKFIEDDLNGMFLVCAATDDHEENRRIAGACNRYNIPVNCIDEPALCDFHVPSVLRRKELTVAVSTGGGSPLFAKKVREELEEMLPRAYGDFLELLSEVREEITGRVTDPARRRKIFHDLVCSDIFDLVKSGQHELARKRIKTCILLQSE